MYALHQAPIVIFINMYPTVDNSEWEQSIREKLTVIAEYLKNELSLKQSMITLLEQQVNRLSAALHQKEEAMLQLDKQLRECQQTQKGTRQLINKLLSDISTYERDLSWFRRTYEERSLPGIIKDRILRPVNTADTDKDDGASRYIYP